MRSVELTQAATHNWLRLRNALLSLWAVFDEPVEEKQTCVACPGHARAFATRGGLLRRCEVAHVALGS